jgi:hypothetical protein
MKILWFLKNSLEVADAFNSSWEDEFKMKFPVGSQAQIKLPQSWLVTTGLAYQEQGIQRLVTTVNLDQIKGVHFGYDSYEKLIKMERSEKEMDEAYFRPAGLQLAQQIDSDAANWASLWTNNVVGTLGTDSTTIDFALNADQVLFNLACPEGGKRHLVLSSSLMRSYVKNNVTQYNPQKDISDMFRIGVLGTAAGWKWFRSNSLFTHTIGTFPTHGVTVVGAGQSGSSLIVTGTNGDTITPGDKFTIALVNSVNPRTRIKTPLGLKNFVYTGGNTFTFTGGNDTITISPAIFGPGSQYQNVDALPANAAALTAWPGTTSPSGVSGTVSLGLSDKAFLKAFGKFDKPDAVEHAEDAVDPETGASLRLVVAWDQYNSKITNRFDCCYGFGNAYSDAGAVAVAGA